MTTASKPLLELRGLQVAYGGIRAVRGIDLRVDEGELVCLIGANGAGKSTTLRAICGLVRWPAAKWSTAASPSAARSRTSWCARAW
ncbi:Nickel import ATP-binding protein NikO [Achromobacter xylosoxidans]|nr:Nickel import ATP-binding protein NikO [Achromobacter xylosoxidans]